MKFTLGLASLLFIIPLFATKRKVVCIINDTGKQYVVQIKRSNENGDEYLCRAIYGLCLADFSYEVNTNKLETVWHKHATRLAENVAYKFVMNPKDSLSLLIFARANKLTESSYSFESLPHSISLSQLLPEKERSDKERESSEPARIQLLHAVKSHEYSPRVDQKKLLKANL